MHTVELVEFIEWLESNGYTIAAHDGFHLFDPKESPEALVNEFYEQKHN